MVDLGMRRRSDNHNAYSTSGVREGSAKGTILRYQKRGRAYAIGQVDIGGKVEHVCFEAANILSPGDRISFKKVKDSSCMTGIKGTNVKVL